MDISTTPMPHSPDLERAVLAVGMICPALVDEIGLVVQPRDFYLERHREIWGAILEAREEHGGTEVLDVKAILERNGRDRPDTIAYLAGLDLELPALNRWPSYARALRVYERRREMIRVAHRALRAGFSESDPESALSKLSSEVERIRGDGVGVEAYIDSPTLADRYGPSEELDDEEPGVSTRLHRLDAVLGKLGPGRLIILGGRPGNAKSALALQVAVAAAHERRPTAFVSLEMSERELWHRILANVTSCSHERIRAGARLLNPRELDEVREANRSLARADRIWIHDAGSEETGESIATRFLQARREIPYELLIVDYAQLCAGDPRMKRYEQVGAVARSLKMLAKSTEIPVLLLAQVGRPSREGKVKPPQLHDLRESGDLEAHADQVIFVHRPELYLRRGTPEHAEAKGLAEILIAKNRHGETNKRISTTFDGPTMRFLERSES